MLYPDGEAGAVLCQHPAIEKLAFNATDYLDIEEDDRIKLKYLIDKILKLKVGFVPGVDVRFEFPFQYDPVWITDCEGFKK